MEESDHGDDDDDNDDDLSYLDDSPFTSVASVSLHISGVSLMAH